ncbi:MAG: hypothetical protein HC905_01095 [Bacteroidales bacterium]|nr:hypothetical protein [Bacteroidales bacterium]
MDLLIDNALKFTDKGYIKVAAFGHGDEEIIFRITDTGIGILPDKKDIIYKPFRQCDESTGRKYNGNGLGLFIAKSLVEILKGKMWYESEPGKGTTFSFTVKRNFC